MKCTREPTGHRASETYKSTACSSIIKRVYDAELHLDHYAVAQHCSQPDCGPFSLFGLLPYQPCLRSPTSAFGALTLGTSCAVDDVVGWISVDIYSGCVPCGIQQSEASVCDSAVAIAFLLVSTSQRECL